METIEAACSPAASRARRSRTRTCAGGCAPRPAAGARPRLPTRLYETLAPVVTPIMVRPGWTAALGEGLAVASAQRTGGTSALAVVSAAEHDLSLIHI